MTVIPRRDDDIRFVPPPHDDEADAGIREGDDGDFLLAIRSVALRFAIEAVGAVDANLIADEIMDAVAPIRRRDPTFLDDDVDRRIYVQRCVVNKIKGTHRTYRRHARLQAMHAELITDSTSGSRFAAPDRSELAALAEHEHSELMEYVARAVDDLGEKCQEVVRLTYVEELPPRVIAKALGIKPDSVHSHLKRANEKVREAVRQYLIDHFRGRHS